MNALVLADLFKAQFEADATFCSRQIHNGQAAEEMVRPNLIFTAGTKALNASGSAFTFSLTVAVEDSADRASEEAPDPAAVHAEAVAAVRAKLFGDQASVKAAMNAAQVYDIRGWSCVGSEPETPGHYFRTPVVLTGTARELTA